MSGTKRRSYWALGMMTVLLTAIVVASDPERPGWDNSEIVGRAAAPGPYDVVEVLTDYDFHFPVAMRTVPEIQGSGEPQRLLIVELRGRVYSVTYRAGDEPQRDLMFDLELGDPEETANVWAWPGQFYAVEFDQHYPKRPFVYICYNISTPDGRVNRLSRLEVTQHEPPRADIDTEHVLIEWATPGGHRGADVHFGPDGMLYVSTGDGASPRDPDNIGQTVDNVLGSILRIDVNVPPDDEKGYRIPDDNPFVDMDDVQPEVYAYGLRNPWRMAFDEEGRLWVGDVGEEAWEMIYLIEKGANYGWSTYEGNHPFRPDNPLAGPTPERTPPVKEHPHTEARSITGGLVYRGPEHDELYGHYVYGDFVTRRVWAFRLDEEGDVADHRLLANSGYQIVAFGEDHDRELYILTEESDILQLSRRPDTDPADDQPSEPFPQRLSETGLLDSVAEHEPAEGVIEYHVNAPAWRDGARGERLLAMPAGAGFQPDQQRQWNLPEGGAAAMTLSLPVPDDDADDGIRWRRVETRLIHRDQGLWHFHTYRWNDDETDAYLVGDTGDNATYEILDEQSGETMDISWRYQTGSECATCHVREAGLTLGLNEKQLNRTGPGGRNQLSVMHELDLLFVDASDPDALPRYVDPHDASAALDARARAYLAANCAHCHREGGAGGRAPFDARAELTLEQMNMLNVTAELPVHAGEGGKLVKPGSPDDSELWQRVAAPLIGRMPPVGNTRVDGEGVQLLKQWILNLENR